MHKTANSKLLELLNLDQVSKKTLDHVSHVDMGLIWQLANPTPEEGMRRDGSEYRRSDYLDKICDAIFTPLWWKPFPPFQWQVWRMKSMIDRQQNMSTSQIVKRSCWIQQTSVQETRSDCKSLWRISLKHMLIDCEVTSDTARLRNQPTWPWAWWATDMFSSIQRKIQCSLCLCQTEDQQLHWGFCTDS